MPEQNQNNDKYLSRLDVWGMSFGCMVGWGAFVMPGTTFLPIAGPAGTIISMIIGLAIMLVIGSCISYLMTRSSVSGGIYAYTKEALGRDHAFLCAWFLCLSYLTIVFLNGTALFLVLRAMFGDAAHQGFHYTIAGKSVYLLEVLLSMGALVGIGLLFLLAQSVLRHFATLLAMILVAGIAVTSAVCLPHANPHDIFGTFGYQNVNLGFAVFSLVILAPWAFVGFEVVTFDTTRFKFPVRKTKGVITSSIIVAAFAYILMAVSSAAVIPDGYDSWQAYISSLGKLNGIVSIPTFYAAQKTMGTAGLCVIGMTALAAILTGIIGAYRATVNLLSTMAEDKILSTRFSKAKYCISFIMALSVIISLLGRNTLSWFIDLTAFGAIVAYGYTSLAAYKIAKTKGNFPIMAAGAAGTVISILFGIAQLIPRLVALDAMCSEAFLLLSLWCLIGFVFYWRMVKRSSLTEYSSMATSGLVLFTLLLYTAMMWLGKLLIRKTAIDEVQNTLIAGGGILMLIIFTGLMVMRYIQTQVSKMHEAAKREKIRVSESSLARNQFLLNMSHDLRTPMNAIIGFTTLALKEPDFMLRDYLKRIDKSGRQLQTLLNNILEMSRVENDKFELQPVPTDLCMSFEELNDVFLESMKKKRINFTVYNSGIQNRFVWCDRKNLQHVFLGIISNSRKFTPEGGTVSAFLFETGTGENGYSSYEMRFQDTGSGMSEDLVARLFDVPTGEQTSDALDENGVSLPFAKKIIEQMGGSIEVFSTPGNGTEIIIRVNFRLASEKDMKREIAAVKAASRVS